VLSGTAIHDTALIIIKVTTRSVVEVYDIKHLTTLLDGGSITWLFPALILLDPLLGPIAALDPFDCVPPVLVASTIIDFKCGVGCGFPNKCVNCVDFAFGFA
jgi:hypothetical protein